MNEMSSGRGVLFVAYHYPPIQASSGVHRTLSFSGHFVRNGWTTTVLTVSRNALFNARPENEAMIPNGVKVVRAFALDTTRHLSIKGRYFDSMAIPDRWVSWVPSAVARGLFEIACGRVDVIVSTYPIASAHIIGYILHRLTGKPWVADLRDPMAQVGYPSEPREWRAFRWIEDRIVRYAERVIYTAPGAKAFYESHYGERVESKGCVIPNGYDEAMFERAEAGAPPCNGSRAHPLKLLHSGIMYPSERDPRPFFQALSELAAAGTIPAGSLRVTFRGAGHEAYYEPLLREYGIDDIVEILPSVGYQEAVSEMLEADALLLFQAGNCNYQVPAKLYEYLRSRRPILAITDAAGDTASILREVGIESIAAIDSAAEIEQMLGREIESSRENSGRCGLDEEVVRRFSREARAAEMRAELESILALREQ